MAITYMLAWWYGQGWGWLLKTVRKNLKSLGEVFSLPILLKTWFAPWKQIRTDTTFRNFFQAEIDNFISRFIGAVIRTFVLFAAFTLLAAVLAGGAVMLVLWPVLPLLVFLLPLAALVV